MNARMYNELRTARKEFSRAPKDEDVLALAAEVEDILADNVSDKATKLQHLLALGKEMAAALDACEVGVSGRLFEGVKRIVGRYREEGTCE